MRFRTFLFDLDGTLIDHFTAIHRCHSHTLRHFGLPEPTLEEVRRVVGQGLEHAVAKLLGPANAGRIAEALPIYRAHWERTMLDDVVLLPGAGPLLEQLRAQGARSAVLTNKHGPSARQICTHFGLDHLLDGVFGASDTPWLKPDRRFTEHAMAKLGANAGSTLLVGDSPYDINTAQEVGSTGWMVTTGTHTAAELQSAGADLVLPHLAAIAIKLGLSH